ncbi:MAG: ABC-2 family transporter protein [Treponema sp.]|nr:ABC-2 family transporter protein [Treponema sp.]MBR6295460.1 ABC-2 family transporter protein [Treponema sp.]
MNACTNMVSKKRGLGFYLRIYGKILVQDLKSKMSYRADFIISTIGMVISNLTGFLSFAILFRNFSSINGWTVYEMLFLYGFSLIALTPVQCFFDNNWNLRFMVRSGDFIKYCFRPINIFFYYISEVFDVKGLGQLAFGIGTLVYAWTKLAIPVTPLVIVELLVFLFAASLFMIAIMNFAAATCFWIINSGYFMVVMFRFKDYAKYPASIFNGFFRIIFTFVIPIAFIAYYPSLALLRPENVPLLTWLSPLIGMFFFYLSYKFWMLGARKYDGTGS